MKFTRNRFGLFALTLVMLIVLSANSAAAQGKSRAAVVRPVKKQQITAIEAGQKIRVNIDNGARRGYEGTFTELNDGFLCVEGGGEIRLDSLMTTDSVTYIFCSGGAVYDPAGGSLSGITADGTKTTISLADIDHVHVTLSDGRGLAKTIFDAETVRRRLKFDVVYPSVRLVPVESITSLYVWKESKGKATLTAIGALTGLALGYLTGQSMYESQKDDFISYPIGVFVAPMAILGTVSGALLFSAFAPSEGWKKVSMEHFDFGIGPSADGSVGVTVAIKLPL